MGEGIDVAGEDAPGEGLIGTEEVGDRGKLAPEVEVAGIGVRRRMVLKAVGFHDGEEGPAEVGFGASGESEGDDEAIGGEPEFGEKAGKAGAETGGVDDEVAGVPFGTQVAEDGVERGVGYTLPAKAGDDAIEGERRGGGVVGGNFDDGEGSEVVGGRGAWLGSGDGGGRRGRRRGGSEERQAGGKGLAADIEEEGIEASREGGSLGRMVALHEGAASGREHAGGVVELFGEELGADKGVLAAKAGDLLGDELAVGGDHTGDVIGGEGEEALDAIFELGSGSEAALTTEEGFGGPGGAPEDAGGIGAGSHGGNVFVVALDEDILGFVDFEEEVGGGADDIGAGLTGEEEEAGLAEAVDVTMLTRPTAAGELIGVEDALEAAHGVEGLGLPGGGDFDNLGRVTGETGEEVGFDLGLKLVFAGLAGEDDDKAEATGVENAIDHGAGDGDLVGAEGEAAGEGSERGRVEEHQRRAAAQARSPSGPGEEDQAESGSGTAGWGGAVGKTLVKGRPAFAAAKRAARRSAGSEAPRESRRWSLMRWERRARAASRALQAARSGG